jgi:hypothetical protein
VGQQALYPVLRATTGPGWEDPGAVHDRASTPPVASAGGARLLAGNGGGVPGVSRYVDGQRSSQALPRGQVAPTPGGWPSARRPAARSGGPVRTTTPGVGTSPRGRSAPGRCWSVGPILGVPEEGLEASHHRYRDPLATQGHRGPRQPGEPRPPQVSGAAPDDAGRPHGTRGAAVLTRSPTSNRPRHSAGPAGVAARCSGHGDGITVTCPRSSRPSATTRQRRRMRQCRGRGWPTQADDA